MRKYIYLVVGMLVMLSAVYSQNQLVTFPENFDGNTISFTSSPASAWRIDTNYYVSSPKAIHGVVPNLKGDYVTLTTPTYDLSNYRHVLLCFKHICKVSPQDIVRIEYKLRGMGWKVLSPSAYMGKAIGYLSNGFNANSYTEWKAEDSLALPSQSWWKEEVFDVSFEVGMDDEAQFRFILTHGNTPGTQISYGWLIDNIEIIAAPYEIKLPVVDFLPPFIKDTLYSTGTYEINAKVKSQTTDQIENPWLIYTVNNNGVSTVDSILMKMVAGDSLWKATILQFMPNSEVVYSITGKDIGNNTANITSGYYIKKPNHAYGNISVALTDMISPLRIETMGNVFTPIEVLLRNKGDLREHNLSNLYQISNGYTLTLTSQSNTVDGNVTVSPASGNGITLSNSNRIVVDYILIFCLYFLIKNV